VQLNYFRQKGNIPHIDYLRFFSLLKNFSSGLLFPFLKSPQGCMVDTKELFWLPFVFPQLTNSGRIGGNLFIAVSDTCLEKQNYI
jgi:hypothetical protein